MIRLFDTSRLSVDEASLNISETEQRALYDAVLKILTPSVVENLPDYFHNINSTAAAARWFERMTSESRLFIVRLKQSEDVVGFVFIYSDNLDAHIGYLLGEFFWGLGYAKEFLSALILWCQQNARWSRLIGGVDITNVRSSKLLIGLGFEVLPGVKGTTQFYAYKLD